jgi:hypothetical protein
VKAAGQPTPIRRIVSSISAKMLATMPAWSTHKPTAPVQRYATATITWLSQLAFGKRYRPAWSYQHAGPGAGRSSPGPGSV